MFTYDLNDNPVASQLGVELGAHGTPTMILPDGELLAGYRPPKELAAKHDATAAEMVRPERNAAAQSEN